MRLTTDRHAPDHRIAARVWPARTVAVACLTGAMAVVYALDRMTGLAHVQHLYYLPIIFAAIRFGMPGGSGAAAVAVVLYHLANPHTLTWGYEESDIFQIAVFVAVGVVAARLADDGRRLHRLAMTDDLTGLHNLRSFEVEVRSMVRAARTAGTSLALLVIDVDRLKSLNDEHGHLVGAEAVRTVGHIIATHIPADAIACRYGGDEFVIALPHCPVSTAGRVAGALRRAVQASAPVLADVPFPERTLSISIGLACRSFNVAVGDAGPAAVDNEESEALFRAADAALYVAKNGGRNRVHVATSAARGTVSDGLQMRK